MKVFSRWLLVLAFLASTSWSQAHAKTVKVFAIGNSFSQNATQYLKQIVKSTGDEIVIGRAEVGGCPLEKHWKSVEAYEANPESKDGKMYAGKSLKERLMADTWDYVTMQQFSGHSPDVTTYRPYAEKLREYINKLQPQAKVIVHQTWPYRSDAKWFGRRDANSSIANQQEMWEKTRSAYRTIAAELNTTVIPVGDAFHKVNTDPTWGYKPDTTFEPKMAVQPALPDQTNSLNLGYSWNKEGKIALDANHANNAGCYLAGLVWYGFLYKESPEKVTFVPEKVPEDFAAFLRKTAAETLAANPA